MRPTLSPDPSSSAGTAGADPDHDNAAVTATVAQARVLLICCVLAESFSPLPLRDLDIPAVQVRHAVDAALRATPIEYLLDWRRRVTAWSVRWDAARHAAAAYFPKDLPGEDKIPGLDALGGFALTAAERTTLTRLCQGNAACPASRP